MKKNLLALALSLLMVFSSLPASTVRADEVDETPPGEDTQEKQKEESQDEVKEVYEVEADENAGDVLDEPGSEEGDKPADDQGPVQDPATETEPETVTPEGSQEDSDLDYVKTEDDEIYAVTLQGEVAEDLKAAKSILNAETDLDKEDIDELTSELFALDEPTRGDTKSDQNPPTDSEADGTKIIGITTKWITSDTIDNDEDAILYVKPEDNSDQTIKLQINYSLAGEHDYGPGEVQIRIPAEIFWGRPDEEGNRKALGEMVLPFPAAPDTKADFNYDLLQDPDTGEWYYLLVNTKQMEAATKGHIRIAFTDLTPSDLVDMELSDPFEAEIYVKVHTGKMIYLKSNAIQAQFDTEARVVPGSAQKTVRDKIDIVGPSAIPEDQRIEGEEAYVLVSYYAWATIEANTQYTLSIRDFIPDQLGGFILNATSEDGRELDEGVVYEGIREGRTSYFYFKVAYPVSAFTPDEEVILKNSVEFKVTEVDPQAEHSNPNVQDPDPQLVTIGIGVSTPHYTYRLPKWVDPDGHYMIWKNGTDGKNNSYLTRSVNALTTDRTRSDYLIGDNGYYGIYPSALNDLQDGHPVDVSYTINTIGYVFPWTYKEVYPGTGHVDEDGSWVWDIPPARIIGNYLQRPVKMETVDLGTRLERYGDFLEVGTDYEYISIEVPEPRIYWAEPHNINEDGSWYALTYHDGTFLYHIDNDKTKIPDFHLEVMINGEWQPLATVSWSTGSKVITPEAGITVSGNVITLPEGTQSVRNVFVTEKIAGIWYDLRVNIRLKPSDTVMAEVNRVFEDSPNPEIDLWNDADLIATRNDVEQADPTWMIVDIKDIATQGGHPKDGYNELDGYTTDTSVYPYKESEQNIKDIDFSTNTINIKYSARVEVNTFIKEKKTFDQAIQDGRLSVPTHGYWYDLLPEGVRYKEGTVTVRSKDRVIDIETRMVEYEGTQRQLLIVELEMQPTAVRYQDGDTFYYQDIPSIEFWAEYSLENMSAYGDRIHNVIAFEADIDQFGTIENYRGEADDPTIPEENYNNVSTEFAFADEIEKQMMKDLDPNRDTPSFVYAGCYTSIDEVDATRTYLRKDVDVNDEQRYTSGLYYNDPEGNRRDVYEGGNYTYRLTFGNNDETVSSGIRIFDSLETFHAEHGNDDVDIDKPVWKGTFNGIDVHNLVNAGCDPVVYYATENLPLEILDPTSATGIRWHPENTDLNDESIWIRADKYEGDLSEVKMIAIDATKQPLKEGQTEADDFELQPDESFMIYIHMIAPSGEEARELIAEDGHAYNNAYMQATSWSTIAQSPEFSELYTRVDYTKVGMKEHNIEVIKEWDDQNNRDGLRPIQVVYHLIANKVDTGETLTLPTEKGEWFGAFEHIPYADANGPIHYSVTEDIVDAYTGQLIKEDDTTFKFVNTHEPIKINLPGHKTWEDDDETTRPSSLKVHLFADGEEIRTINVKADPVTGEWDYVFENLYKYKEGEEGVEIVYTVTEEVTGLVSSYIPEYDGMNIINHYHPYGDLYLEKIISNLDDILDNEKALNKEFEFTFEFVKTVDGEPVPVDTNYEYEILEDDVVVDSGWIGVDYTWTISIRYDQKIHIKEIDENVNYTITEAKGQGFRLITSTGASGIIVPNETVYSTFTNEYKAKGRINLQAIKRLECSEMEPSQFSFTVYQGDKIVKTSVIRTVEVVYNEDGSVSYSVSPVTFGAISYDETDAGKTYTYRIVEATKTDGTDGVIYDRTTFYADVTIEDKNANGELDVSVRYYDEKGNDLDELVFNNQYRAKGSKVITAWKRFIGRDLEEGQFTFELFMQNEEGEWELYDVKENDGEGVVSFEELYFDQNDNGKEFYFLVREVKGNEDTVIYDESYFGYKLTVTDNHKGTLSVDEVMIDPENVEVDEKGNIISVTWKEGEGSLPVFVNELQPGILQIVKYIDPESEDFDPEQEFTFHVKLTGDNLPSGQIPFVKTTLDSQFPPVIEPIPWDLIDFGKNAGTSAGEGSPLLRNSVEISELKKTTIRQNGAVYHATDEELAGNAYAILDADGNLVFFRSEETYANRSEGTVNIDDETYTGTIYAGFENTTSVSNIWPKGDVKTIKVAQGQAIRPLTINSFFNGMYNLLSGDFSRFDTSLVTNLRDTFKNCSSLTELDLSTWDVSNVTSGMGSYEGASIQSAYYARSYVFNGCSKLEKLNCSNWNPNAGYYYGLFSHLPALTELKLENVTLNGTGWATFLFVYDTSLEVLDLSTFYIQKGGRWTNLSGLFQGSPLIKEITLNSSFVFMGASDDGYYTNEMTYLPTPTGEGYSGRWIKKYEDSNAYTPTAFSYAFNANPREMAGTWVWESDIFTVAFTGEDVIGSMSDVMYSAIKNNTLPANRFIKFGYEFDHWVDEENGYEYENEGTIPKDRYTMGDHIVLKAVFKKIDTSVDMTDGEFNITLKGGEMATFYGLPAGTSYQVTEINIPDGWTLVNIQNGSGYIESLETVTAYFTDRYTPNIASARFDGLKLLDGRAAEPREFYFQMTEDGAKTIEIIDGFNGEYYSLDLPFLTSSENGGGIDFPTIIYREPGVHTYRIREMDPNDESVIKDSHEEVVTVTVTEKEDGTLVADIVYDNDGIVFRNTSRPGGLIIYKEGNVDENTQNDEFTFKVTFTSRSGDPLSSDTPVHWFVQERTEPVPTINGDIVDYPDKEDVKPIDDPIIGPVKPTKENRNELKAEGTVYTVTFNANGGKIVMKDGEYDEYSVNYDSPSVWVHILGEYEVKGMEGYGLRYWTTNEDGSGTQYNPNTGVRNPFGENETITLYAQWGKLAKVTVNHYKQNDDMDGYTLADTDVYEVLPGTKFWCEARYADRDPSYYGYSSPEEIMITVSENDDENIVDYKYDRNDYTVRFDGNGADSGSMDDYKAMLDYKFRLPQNEYSRNGAIFWNWNTEADGSGDSYGDTQTVPPLTDEVGATVTLYAQWQEAETVYPEDGVVYVKCRVGESIVFPDLPEGTSYTIEEEDLPSGWTLVGYKGDTGVIHSMEICEAYITNEHHYKPAYVELLAYKNLIGREVEEGEFTFELTNKSGKVLQTAENGPIDDEEYLLDEDGNTVLDENGDPVKNPFYGLSVARFDQINYTEDDIGYRFTYYVHEVVGTDMGIRYDTTEYMVTVEVTAGEDGRVQTDVKYYLKDDLADPVFTNTLAPGSLEITKITADGSTDTEFTFLIEFWDEDGNEISTEFDGVKYTYDTKEPITVKSGDTITLKHKEQALIKEIPAGTRYRVTEIDIPKNWELISDNNLEGVIVSNNTASVTFTNKKNLFYDTEVVLEVNKKVVGGNNEEADNFTFELQDPYGNVIQSRNTDEFGGPLATVTFDPIVYSQADAGTYTYYIFERQGKDNLVNYDKKIYEIEVEITDTGEELLSNVKYLMPSGNELIEIDDITFINEKFGNIRILKIDGETEEPLAGAIFNIDKDGQYLQPDGKFSPAPYDFVTDEDGYINVRKVPSGTYTLHEVEAPEGYELGEDMEFEIFNSKLLYNEKTVEFITAENNPVKTDIVIRKVDEETKDVLADAVFTIKKEGGKYLQKDGSLDDKAYKFTTDENGEIRVSKVGNGTYTLHETKAPEGYELAEDVTFTVKNGEVLIDGEVIEVVMVNDPPVLAEILIRKVDEKTKDVLADAKFTIASGDLYLQKDGSLSEKEYEFTTDANGEIKVSNVRNGEYVLHETKAPKGYKVAKDVTFTVEDGKMLVKDKVVKVIMVNDPPVNEIVIKKVDEKTNEVLAGAVFTITDEDGKYLQKDGSLKDVLCEFMTDANGEIRIADVKDGKYVLHETKAPKGYKVAKDVSFTVKGGKLLVGGEAVKVITVKDSKSEKPPKPPVPPTSVE